MVEIACDHAEKKNEAKEVRCRVHFQKNVSLPFSEENTNVEKTKLGGEHLGRSLHLGLVLNWQIELKFCW